MLVSKWITHQGYVRLSFNGHKILQHRHIIEQVLGRPLQSNEEVHHINGNKQDNRVENLKLLTELEHNGIHHRGKPRPDKLKDMSKWYCFYCLRTSDQIEIRKKNGRPHWRGYGPVECSHICGGCDYHVRKEVYYIIIISRRVARLIPPWQLTPYLLVVNLVLDSGVREPTAALSLVKNRHC